MPSVTPENPTTFRVINCSASTLTRAEVESALLKLNQTARNNFLCAEELVGPTRLTVTVVTGKEMLE
jgi:hypothetical protein